MNLILIHSNELHADGTVCLTDFRAEHIRKVLRAEPGKKLRIGLLNGPKGCGTVKTVGADKIMLHCEFEENRPARPPVDLLLALPRPKVMKRLWAQLAALGVGRIVLVNAEKVERYYFDSHVLEPDFYNARLIEGLQQAGDTLLPEVRIVKELKPFLEDELDAVFPDIGKKLIADPSGTDAAFEPRPVRRSLGEGGSAVPQRSCLAIGPEGGWTPYELDLFKTHGFELVGMGPRILRTDTATVALVALATQSGQ